MFFFIFIFKLCVNSYINPLRTEKTKYKQSRQRIIGFIKLIYLKNEENMSICERRLCQKIHYIIFIKKLINLIE